MSNLLVGTQSKDLPTILNTAGIESSPINVGGLEGYFTRGIDSDVMEIRQFSETKAKLGKFNQSYNGLYALKGLFENLRGTPATIYVKRLLNSDAVASSVSINNASANPVLKFEAGQKGIVDKGTWGDQLWVNITDSSRGNSTLAADTTATDTTITLTDTAVFQAYDWVAVEKSVTADTLVTSLGSTTTESLTFTSGPIVPDTITGSATLTTAGAITFQDDGEGNLVGVALPAGVTLTGTVDYVAKTGSVTITGDTFVAGDITADYAYDLDYTQVQSIDETNSLLNVLPAIATGGSLATDSETVRIVDRTVYVYFKDEDTGAVELAEPAWENVNMDPNSPYYVETLINDQYDGSQYVMVTHLATADVDTIADFPVYGGAVFGNSSQLTSGSNGSPLNTSEMAAQHAYFDDYNIVYLGNVEAMSEANYTDGELYCSVRENVEWLGTMSTPEGFEAQRDWIKKLQASRKIYATVNGTWIGVSDPAGLGADPLIEIPATGHIMGYKIYKTSARGIHTICGGLVDTLQGVRYLVNELVSRRELTDLVNLGMNNVTQISGAGFCLRSDRTPSKLAQFKFGNQLRMSTYFKQSFEQSLAIYENVINKGSLIDEITKRMKNFALAFYKSSSNGGAQGGFYEGGFNDVVIIQADDFINTQANIKAGELRVNFYFAAPVPAERILIGVGLIF
jgi:hypothetical protein